MSNAVVKGGHFHAVRFYEDSNSLCRIVSGFIAEGLALSQPALVIATKAHADCIEGNLTAATIRRRDGEEEGRPADPRRACHDGDLHGQRSAGSRLLQGRRDQRARATLARPQPHHPRLRRDGRRLVEGRHDRGGDQARDLVEPPRQHARCAATRWGTSTRTRRSKTSAITTPTGCRTKATRHLCLSR